jgi:transposase
MLREKERNFQPCIVTLDALVPPDNFYRHLEATINLNFVRDIVKQNYAQRMGRPSIDPVVFFKLQLIMFFEGIRSERQLMKMVNLHLAYRWYIGYDLHEAVPDHSSLSKIRTRYGFAVFQHFFEHIVELCIEAGLVWGKELYFDGTKVQANADVDSLKARLHLVTQQHLQTLFPEASIPSTPLPLPAPPQRWLEKYRETRVTVRGSHSYHRTADKQVSHTDPDATPMKMSNRATAALGYHTHYVVDGGKARIILAALVTPASVMDNTPMLDLARWVSFRWRLAPDIAVGDTKYGTIANIVGLEQHGIRTYFPVSDLSQRNGFYPPEQFDYDSTRDLYICPQGQALPLRSRRKREEMLVYVAHAAICNVCPVKAWCTESKSGRHIFRSFFQEYLDRAARYRETVAYKKALRKRQIWVEPVFGEGKQWHGMSRFRLRRLEKVNIEGLIRAAGQNIKRLLKARTWRKPLKPAGSVALHSLGIWQASVLMPQLQFLYRLFQHAVCFCAMSYASGLSFGAGGGSFPPSVRSALITFLIPFSKVS